MPEYRISEEAYGYAMKGFTIVYGWGTFMTEYNIHKAQDVIDEYHRERREGLI